MRPAFDEAWFASRAVCGVQGLRAYDPGHDVPALREGQQWLVELGSNENPYGASPGARGAVLDALHLMHRYPDPRGAGLKSALARQHGVEPNQIVLGNGSHELLMQFAQVFAGTGDEVVFSQYGFAVFALAAQAAGATPRVAPALPVDALMPLGHDVDAMLGVITPATKLVYIANPNNPTGTWLDAATLTRLVRAMPPTAIIVVDEAYAELADAPDYASALHLTGEHRNVVVTRTFSKAYALAGLRCGYAIAAPGLVAVMERVRESFNVNSIALASCEAALLDAGHLTWCREQNATQRSKLTEQLRKRGLDTLPSQTNFLLVFFGERTSPIEAALLDRGIVLRPMGGYGLPEYSRITVGTADENARLLRALDEVLA